jgi:hypothetical protein
MRTAVLIALLVAGSCVQAFAADPPKGPSLADLMKQPANRAAWYGGMFAGATPPQWVDDYAKTLDGPPTPSCGSGQTARPTRSPLPASPNSVRQPALRPCSRRAGQGVGIAAEGNEKSGSARPTRTFRMRS